jgi:hypothetical protein
MKLPNIIKIRKVWIILILSGVLLNCAGLQGKDSDKSSETYENINKTWKARISSWDKSDNDANSAQTEKLIKKIKSLSFENSSAKKDKDSQEPPREKPLEKDKKNEQNEEAKNPKTEQNKENDNKKLEQYLKKITSESESTEHPLEVAEILFNAGYQQQAGVFYETALNKKELAKEDKSWVLFQLGNSFEDCHPAKAREYYQQLLVKYKDSEWSKTADAKLKILKLKQDNSLKTLISKGYKLETDEKDSNEILQELK